MPRKAANPPDPAQPKRGRGRPKGSGPIKWSPAFVRAAQKMAELGGTEQDIAQGLGVSASTLGLWRVEHPEFAAALRVGKDHTDARVEQSLLMRAVGYERRVEKVMIADGVPVKVKWREYFPPNVTAIAYWLNNRKPKDWRNRTQEEREGAITPQDIARAIKEMREAAES